MLPALSLPLEQAQVTYPWPAVHPATFPNSAQGFCMCRSSLQTDSPHFNDRGHLLKGREKFLNLSLLTWHQLTAVVTATAIPSSVPGPTHTSSLLFFTQISYHTSFAFAELKPHPNSLHSLTYKLHALQPRFNLRLTPSVGCAHQDLHSSKYQWNTVTGCNTFVCTFTAPAGSCLWWPYSQEPQSWEGLQLPPLGTKGGKKTWETRGPVPTLEASATGLLRNWGRSLRLAPSPSPSLKSGGYLASPIRSIIEPLTVVLILPLLHNSKHPVS